MLMVSGFMADDVFVIGISFIVYIYLVEQKKGCSLISDRIYLKAADSVFLYKASSAYAVYNETGIIDCERQQQSG